MDFNPPGGGTAANSGGGAAPQSSYALSGKIMLISIVILFAVVLSILFLHLYVRWHIIDRSSRRAQRRRRHPVFAGEGEASLRVAANHGLDPVVLKSLPLLFFTPYAGAGEDEQFECAVCLNEFEEGEKVRLLPRCGHRFHIECIDMWFFSHSTCPICRAAVEAVNEPAHPVSAPDPISVDAEGALVSPCQREEEVASSSLDSGGRQFRNELPARRTEAFGILEEDLNLGQGSQMDQPAKSPHSRILHVWLLLMRDPRLNRGSGLEREPDLERGGGAPPLSPPFRHSEMSDTWLERR
ncbi:RING-H2 finger protein ATL2 [Apostasia shenzhenica]|uniref:RING-type E3 ubiquitin transferase n=1 Tax=Apostasia shenzhenica TaxID=1088818 RepID=A0A2I0AQF2_9ASPA|nr:RING-H2 finger protein ATL2 [Apostasia shenzhenica]